MKKETENEEIKAIFHSGKIVFNATTSGAYKLSNNADSLRYLSNNLLVKFPGIKNHFRDGDNEMP